ncbi:MAG TPA: protein phosphatase 2C domain-containing protein [Acidimicrobiales bacterium]|nr:protein phosphatase 2C domain-containing protein [Acidimicrobiales bacterium]
MSTPPATGDGADVGAPLRRPVLGRPSPASDAPWKLRQRAAAADAAVRADGGDDGALSVRVASLAGVRHRVGGTGPEDAYGWCWDAGRLSLAVADGVGSRPGAAAASATAVAAAVDALAAGASPAAAVLAASGAVAGGEGATTLVAATVTPDGAVALARVGDSTAYVRRDGVLVELWVDPDDGASTATTATAALPADDPRTETAEVALAPGEALVVVTDGVGDAVRDGPTTVAPALAAALASPPDPLELARITDFSRQGVGDDRTLLAVWVGPHARPEEAGTPTGPQGPPGV